MIVKRTGWPEHQTRVLRHLASFGDQGMQEGLAHVGQALVDQYQANIARGRSPRGVFRKLSPAYAKAKARRWGSQPILVASGSMRDGLGFRASKLGEGRWRLEAGATGTDSDGVSNGAKAGWHIEGTPTMPKRDFGAVPVGLLSRALASALKEIASRFTVTVPVR